MNYKNDIREYIETERRVLAALDINRINEALNLIVETGQKGKRIYVFGNGGSAATASHIQNDFNKGISLNTDLKFRFQCLNDNVATMMAIANDIGYDEVFRLQLDGILDQGDVILAISGSGNSPNVINAVEYAKSQGNRIIGFTGYGGGKLAQLSDVHLNAPVNSMQMTEDIHMIFDHLMMSILYKHLCGIDHLAD